MGMIPLGDLVVESSGITYINLGIEKELKGEAEGKRK